MASVQAVGNTFLRMSFNESIPVSPMKLQKLMYFAYRDYLQETGKKMFGENFQTWKFGPVLGSIYDEFKSYGSSRIAKFARDAKGDVYVVSQESAPLVYDCISRVWERYKHCTGIQLSQKTHLDGTAWTKAREREDIYLDDEDIRNDSIM